MVKQWSWMAGELAGNFDHYFDRRRRTLLSGRSRVMGMALMLSRRFCPRRRLGSTQGMLAVYRRQLVCENSLVCAAHDIAPTGHKKRTLANS